MEKAPNMKLYNVPRNSIIRVDNKNYWFKYIDGAYSYCISLDEKEGYVVHLGASTEVEYVGAYTGEE